MGFTFNGRHSNDFGITTKIRNRPHFPEPKNHVEDDASRDGEDNFSAANPDGRTRYEPKIIEVECGFVQKDMAHIQIRAHEIAVWLAAGEKKLIFDDEKALEYWARVANRLDLETLIARVGKFILAFRCRPFADGRCRSDIQIPDAPEEAVVVAGYGYRFDMVPTIYTVTGNKTISVYNAGNWYVKPKIKIAGSFTNISLSTGGRTLNYNTPLSNAEILLDCNLSKAIKDNAINVNNNVSGQYLELSSGFNPVEITGTALNCTVTFVMDYKYL